ncbi:hypothetical protein LBMAG49_19050 [Planctomycetota bacterium]|nr:hypothetical protein LBMAG49_19050 [Planctomycetota bacterium]
MVLELFLIHHAKPTGVGELKPAAIVTHDHCDTIARDASRGLNDRHASADEPIEQARFADVRSADDRNAGQIHGKRVKEATVHTPILLATR